jgi:transcription initiation factor TFIIIB Brf1 subunit/transcription initiation factor TFIIB
MDHERRYTAQDADTGYIAVIQKLCKRLGLRQQVIASAIVFFRRFYLRNSYCDTEPSLVAAACCYVAAKAEETPVHVKSAVAEGKVVFTGTLHPHAALAPDLTSFAR